jgi:uncharacterized protein (TIGR02996 family)
MSDETALLAAIWEYPHEDTPRLVYADWLTEHGQPERAEFIRVQCELAQLGEWDESPRKVELEKRQKHLWTKYAKAWKAGLSAFLQKRTGFHRGFLAPPLREMPSSRFLKLTADDFAGAPLWGFHLPPNHELLPKLLASPLLQRLGVLDFRYWLESTDDWRLLATSPNVRNITELYLGGARYGEAGFAELAAGAGGLPHLRKLNLDVCDLTARAMEALGASPLANGLRELLLFLNPIGADGILALARSPRLARLERLDLKGCEGMEGTKRSLTREAVVALFSSPHLRALKDVALDPTGFKGADMKAVCATRPVFRLRAFRFQSNGSEIGDAGASALAAWPALEDVRVLHLYDNGIGAAGARALARSAYLNKITDLRLDLNPLEDDPGAVRALRDRFGDAVRID